MEPTVATAGRQPNRLRPERYSRPQRRSIDAATELFAENGVQGTSFSMIADEVGVTKAAIYHQFKTKRAIVLAVAEVGLAPLEEALDTADAQKSPELRRATLLESVIGLAVERRRWVNALQGDPVMIRLLASHPPFADLMTRIYSILLGVDHDGPTERTRIAIVSATIGGAIAHPLVADLDDDSLRIELLAVTRRLFGLSNREPRVPPAPPNS